MAQCGTMAWLLLSGLPTTITKDDIERLLNASVEAVLHVNILEEGEKMATVKVMGLKDPERFFQQRHKISDKDISVELITDTIVVTIVSGAADVGVDLITAYLEGPTSGGGVEKEVEMAKAISKGVYNVRLSSTEDTLMIICKTGGHKFLGNEVKIAPRHFSSPSNGAGSPSLSATHSNTAGSPSLSATHSNAAGSPSLSATHSNAAGSPSLSATHSNAAGSPSLSATHSNAAGFPSLSATHSNAAGSPSLSATHSNAAGSPSLSATHSNAAGSPSLSATHSNAAGSPSLSATHSNAAGSPSLSATHSNAAGSPSLSATHSNAADSPSLSAKHSTAADAPSSSSTHSTAAGCHSLSATHSNTDGSLISHTVPSDDLLSASRASSTFNRSDAVKETLPVVSQDSSCQQYHADRLLIVGKPEDWNDVVLKMEIEDILDLEETEYSLQSHSAGHIVLVLAKCYTEQELVEITEKLLSNSISTNRCEFSRKILVTNITTEFYNVEALKRYFGRHKRSGGGSVENVSLLKQEKAIVTFQDHKVISSVLEKKHSRLGSDVQITVYDDNLASVESDDLSDRSPSPPPPRIILVSNITESGFQNETALTKYFGNAKRSGGGEIETTEYHGNGRATITFKNHSVVPSVLGRDHPKLGKDVQVFLFSEEDKPVPVPQQPLSFTVDKLVASYLKWKPSQLTSALSMLEVTAIADDDNNTIVVTPSSSSPADWEHACQKNLLLLTQEKVIKIDLVIVKEARGEMLAIIMKENQNKGVKYDVSDSSDTVSVAGEAETINSLNATLQELYATVVTKEENCPINNAALMSFLECYMLNEIKPLHPKLKFTLSSTEQSLVIFGSIKDLSELKEKLPEYFKYDQIPLNLQPLELKLINQLSHQDIVQEQSEVVPFFEKGSTGEIESLVLLYSPQHSLSAENVVSSIRDRIKMDAHPLPSSFKNKVVHSPDFLAQVQQMKNIHKYTYEIRDRQLVVAGLDNSASEVSQVLIHFIKEGCAVTRTVHMKRGVWRLLNTAMHLKWNECSASIRRKGVEIVNSSKQSSKKPYIIFKGEPDLISEVDQEFSILQSSICQKRLPIGRPGIAKFFNDSHTLLFGIECKAKVCIEVSTGREEQNTEIPISHLPSKFVKVCSGSTRELKTVNVYIGDITMFNRAEVIVNAANEDLKHIGGVALAIAKKGGPVIQEDSDDYVSRRGKVQTGTAVLQTRVGSLPPPYKAIVHAVGPTWNRSSSNHDREIALLKKTCKRALVCAQDYGSIAIPAISSGVYGFPIDACADALVRAVVEFSENNEDSDLCDINFIILKDNADVFQKAVEHHIQNATIIQPPNAKNITSSSSSGVKKNRSRRRTLPSIDISQSYQPAVLQCIKITKGSILSVQANALVNTTDTNLGFGGFVSKALLKAAGDTLKDECASKAPVPVGGVAVTGAGNLKCKHIMHVVLPNYDGPGGQSEKELSSVVQQCLDECTKLGLSSIAIPSIGAGNLNYPDDVVARCLLDGTASYLKKNQGNTSLKLVHFVIFVPRTHQVFQQHFRSMTDSSAAAISSTSFHKSGMVSEEGVSRPNTVSESTAIEESSCSFSLTLTPTLQLVILQGDISDDDSHVIVNTTNERLNLAGAGAVSRAILRKAGQSLQTACNALVAQEIILEEGKPVLTKATGNLRCREVFHILFNSGDEKRFVQTILACLQKTESKKYQSIAFPAIGTGVSGYPPAKAAKGMVKALRKFVSKNPEHVQRIRIVLFQQPAYQEFVESFVSAKKESGEAWYTSVIKAGAKVLGSLFSMDPMLSDEEKVDENAKKESEDEEECDEFSRFGADVSIDEDELVVTIFGETVRDVSAAEKQIMEVVEKQFVTKDIDDKYISKLSLDQIKELEKEATMKHVVLEVDVDPVLHSAKLHGSHADVLLVKDKIRDVLSALKQEEAKGAAAFAVQKNVCWYRQCSGDKEEEYDPIINFDIEEAYKQKERMFSSSDDCERFTIDFDAMEETDMDTGDVVKVKRVVHAEVEKPADWVSMPTDSKTGKEAHVHLVTLDPGSFEYKKVENQFTATMVAGSNFTKLVSIERLQNPNLYGQYIARKKQMDKHNPEGTQNERWLYHGTTSDTCEKINTQGFNRSFKGKNGTAYGEGVYFARDSRYSNSYARADAQGYRKMYLTQVLTGEFIVGNQSTKIPPPKNPQVDPNILFDSTVDNIANPQIFVVYFDALSYPAYLITYQ